MFEFTKFKFIQLLILWNLPILILVIGIISIPIEISNSTSIFQKRKITKNIHKFILIKEILNKYGYFDNLDTQTINELE